MKSRLTNILRLLALFFTVYDAVGRDTVTKPWVYKNPGPDDIIEWSDDYGHNSRLIFNYTGKIRKFVAYCRGDIYDTGLIAERIYFCMKNGGGPRNEQPCPYVGPNLLRTKSFVLHFIPVVMEYDAVNKRAVAVIENVGIKTSFGSSFIYCRATPPGKDLGFVWRQTNAIYVVDFRDVGHGKLGRNFWHFKIDGKTRIRYFRTFDTKTDTEVARGHLTFFLNTCAINKWLPTLEYGIEWFACRVLDPKGCYADKSNSVYDIGYNQLKGKWAPTFNNVEAVIFLSTMDKEIYNYLKGRYFMCYIRGELYRITDKLNISTPFIEKRPLFPPWATENYRYLLNDSDISYTHVYTNFKTEDTPVDVRFWYSGKFGKFPIEEGKEYPGMGVRIVRHLGNGIKVLRFQGPFTEEANGLYYSNFYSLKNGSSFNETASTEFRVVPYIQTTKELTRIYTMETKDILVKCPVKFFENTNEFIFWRIEMEILGVYTFKSENPEDSETDEVVKAKWRRLTRTFQSHFKRPVEFKVIDVKGNKTHAPRKQLLLKNFHYAHGLPNRFSLSCTAFPWKSTGGGQGNFQSQQMVNYPWLRTEMLIQVFPVPRLLLRFQEYPCLEVCILLCYFKERESFEKDGVIMRTKWKIGGKPLPNLFSDKYAFFPTNPMPTVECTVSYFNPDEKKKPFKVLSTGLAFGNTSLRLVEIENSAEKLPSVSNFAMWLSVCLLHLLLI